MPQPLTDIVSSLEAALADVKTKKDAFDKAQSTAAKANEEYQKAVKTAQQAHAAYSSHVNEIMSGFAQIHQ